MIHVESLTCQVTGTFGAANKKCHSFCCFLGSNFYFMSYIYIWYYVIYIYKVLRSRTWAQGKLKAEHSCVLFSNMSLNISTLSKAAYFNRKIIWESDIHGSFLTFHVNPSQLIAYYSKHTSLGFQDIFLLWFHSFLSNQSYCLVPWFLFISNNGESQNQSIHSFIFFPPNPWSYFWILPFTPTFNSKFFQV